MSVANNVGRRRTKRLAGLVRSHGSRCHWCGCLVVQIASIPWELRRVVTHNFALWRDPITRTIRQALIATTDHVVPLCEGGADDASNLVVSCRWCNEARGRQWWEANDGWKGDPSVSIADRNESMLSARDRTHYANMRHLLAWFDALLTVGATDAPVRAVIA